MLFPAQTLTSFDRGFKTNFDQSFDLVGLSLQLAPRPLLDGSVEEARVALGQRQAVLLAAQELVPELREGLGFKLACKRIKPLQIGV